MALFVGRLSREITRRELEDAFSEYGTLNRCDLRRDHAFITFDDEVCVFLFATSFVFYVALLALVVWLRRNNNNLLWSVFCVYGSVICWCVVVVACL